MCFSAVYSTAKKAIQFLAVSLLLLLICLPAFPQAELGRITGSISDQTGAVIPGAAVTVTDVQRGESKTLTTDSAGVYFASSLLPGAYIVRVEFKGFKTIERQNVIVETGQEIRVDAVLQAGESVEKITVVEAVQLVNTADAVLGGTISNANIVDLPLNGRDYQQLLTIRPGVVAYAGGGSWTQSTNGVRPDANNWLVDGQLNADPSNGRSVIGVQSPLTDAATLLPVDAIQEFNTQITPKAEIGWKPGATVNVGIKSGTNQLHGTAYAFGRDGDWDARNYFNPSPNPIPPLHLTQWGATVGGPILKDKLFFFGAFETYENLLGVPLTISAPETISAGGDVTNSIPDALAALKAKGVPISAVSTSLLNLFPANPSTGTAVNTAFSNTNTSYNGIGKINYRINERHTISGFLFWSNYLGVGEDRTYVNSAFLTSVPVQTQANNYNWIYTPNGAWVNEFRFGFNRSRQGTLNGDLSKPATAYGLNTGVTSPLSGGLPVIRIAGFTQLGGFSNNPNVLGPNPFYRLTDQVSYFHGKHAFKFGVEFARADFDSQGTGGSRGELDFTGGQTFSGSTALEDFLAGMPTVGKLAFGSAPQRTLRRWQYAAFAQDDWRISPRVTLNLGVRYEYVQPPKELNGLIANFDPTSPTGLVQQGHGIGSVFNGDHLDFAPRLGVAWDVTGKGTTVVRAGYSIQYETVNMNYNTSGLTALPTGALLNGVPGSGTIARTTINYTGSQLAYPLAPGASATIFPSATVACSTASPCNAFWTSQNLKEPFVSNWNVSLQRTLTANLMLEVAYVGNHGSRLMGLIDANAPPIGSAWCLNSNITAAQLAVGCPSTIDPTNPNGALEQAARPYYDKFPYLRYILKTGNLDRSNYNGLQATLTHRLSHGLSITAGYTYSHDLDSGSLSSFNYLPQNNPSGTRSGEYASGDFDIRHRLVVALTYNIPGPKTPGQLLRGWTLNTIVTLQSAQPWVVNDTSYDLTGTGDVHAPGAPFSGMERWDFFGNYQDFKSGGPVPIPFFPGASNTNCLAKATAMGPLAVASLDAFGCYAKGNSVLIPPAPGTLPTLGRNTFPDTGFKNMNLSIYKNWTFKERFSAQFRAEFFNAFNHPNFANPYDGPSGLGQNDPSNPGTFGCGCSTPDVGAGNPIVGSGSMRAVQLGLKLIF